MSSFVLVMIRLVAFICLKMLSIVMKVLYVVEYKKCLPVNKTIFTFFRISLDNRSSEGGKKTNFFGFLLYLRSCFVRVCVI